MPTRLGLGGYGEGSGPFSGKGIIVGVHPVGKITRLGLGGYGVRRTGNFGGKDQSVAPTPPTPSLESGVSRPRRFKLNRVSRREQEAQIMAIIISFLAMINQH